MHSTRSAQPCPALLPYVRAYLQRDLYGRPAPVVEPVPARLEPCLHFNLADPFEVRSRDGEARPVYPASIVGAQTFRRYDIVMSGCVEAFAVFFEPTGFPRLFGAGMGQLVDRETEAGSFLGDGVYRIRDRLGEAGSFGERVRVMEDFLLRQLAFARHPGRFVGAADRIFATRGVVRVADVASQACLSQRQLERGFLAETGCSPKVYARVARFQTALDLKVGSPERTWIEIAHRLYYHDQMHMVRDFQSLAGNSPDRLMAELGNARPKAVAARLELEPGFDDICAGLRSPLHKSDIPTM